MSDLISIIIPVYNHARVLRRCFDSINLQIYRPLEIVVINDGSTDNFSEEMEKIIKNFSGLNIKIINQENRGAPVARNVGFRASIGDFVIFWDADTIARPEMLVKMKSALDNNPDAAYAYSSFKFGWKKMPGRRFDASALKKINYIDVTSLIRQSEFVPFDESLKRFMDWDLWLTLLEKNKTGVFVPETLYKKLVGGRRGISLWLPKFAYKMSWKLKSAREYEEGREVILKKHGLFFRQRQ